MQKKRYYSTRNNKNPLTLSVLLEQFFRFYRNFVETGYFQEAFGYTCTECSFGQGRFGKFANQQDTETYFLLNLNKYNIYPIEQFYKFYSDDDLFDVIEILHDCVSSPVGAKPHGFDFSIEPDSSQGSHLFVDSYDKILGQVRWRVFMNNILENYKEGYKLSDDGYIEQIPPKGLEPLLEEPLVEYDKKNINDRVDAAVEKFKLSRNSLEDKLNAIRDLAGVLEFLNKNQKLKQGLVSNADESDIFNIANNFAIRHHNNTQKTKYNKDIWYDWMFYSYLNTIHAVVKELDTIASAQINLNPAQPSNEATGN